MKPIDEIDLHKVIHYVNVMHSHLRSLSVSIECIDAIIEKTRQYIKTIYPHARLGAKVSGGGGGGAFIFVCDGNEIANTILSFLNTQEEVIFADKM